MPMEVPQKKWGVSKILGLQWKIPFKMNDFTKSPYGSTCFSWGTWQEDVFVEPWMQDQLLGALIINFWLSYFQTKS